MEHSENAGSPDLPWDEILGWVMVEVKAAARHYRLPDEERDELRQQVCLRVLRSLAGFDRDGGAASLQTWVRRHAGWGVADYWRRRLSMQRRDATRMRRSISGTPAPTWSGPPSTRRIEASCGRHSMRVCRSSRPTSAIAS